MKCTCWIKKIQEMKCTCWIKNTGNEVYMLQWKRNTVGPTDKSGKMTAVPIKTLGFQDRLSGIALSFDFVNFVKKKKLVRDLPSRPCLVSGHVWEVLLFHWPFKGILSDSLFFRHPISAITIDLSVSSIGFHKNVPVKMEQKRCSWQTT
jgi:hypothetical protein